MNLSFLKQVFGFLESERLQFLVRGFLSITTLNQFRAKEKENYFFIALFDWFSHLGFVGEATQERLIRELQPTLVRFVANYENEPKEGDCLSIFDQRYFGYLKHSEYLYDSQSGVMVERMEQDPVTIIVCNLRELLKRTLNRVDQVGVNHAK